MLTNDIDNQKTPIIQIAIDGPAGTGKSTIAKLLSDQLAINYLDTGAMYRAFSLHAKESGVSGDAPDGALSDLFNSFGLEFDLVRVLLNGRDISALIRTPEIDKNVGAFASRPIVRERMVQLQRETSVGKNVVMEGRDIGTVVLPDTPYKFYLDASIDVRAQRRHTQNIQSGIDSDLDIIRTEIALRDELDSTREASPLRIAEGSVYIDTSYITPIEVVEIIVDFVRDGERLSNG
ncbi:MAG: (d)CMP kinase [Eubacteriaceae bacterium]|nr:(d)CMP kinase [Eubacteriaceae bacterium]